MESVVLFRFDAFALDIAPLLATRNDNVKIFHGLQNISGMAGVLAAAQRALGHDAISYGRVSGNYGFPVDRVLSANKVKQAGELLRLFLLESMTFDVFHFYFGESLTGPHLLDVKSLVNRGAKVFLYFCGCDIRDAKHVIAGQTISACAECWPTACSANRLLARRVALELASGTFVSTPDLLEFLPGSILLPQPISVDALDFLANSEDRVKERDRNICRIVHAPSSRMLKGTKYLLEAVEVLQHEGLSIELQLIEGLTYQDAMRACREADIAVDQLLIGSYGQFAVEMMALGKPVICRVRDDLRKLYPEDMPIVSADPNTITNVLRSLVEDQHRWAELGRQGRKYVRSFHDSAVVADRALQHYNR